MTNASASSSRVVPRDARLISLILAAKGIRDADERVLHQLLDFAHRYSADVLQSAQQYADHAARTGPRAGKIEKEDIELAIQTRKRYEFCEAPPRDYLASLAHELNSHPLPPLPESFEVIRLPPQHQRLTEVTFDLVPEAELTFSEEDDGEDESDSEDDEDVDEAKTEGGGMDGQADGDADADEDEDMEEVGVGSHEPPPATREIDEDYD